MTLQTFRLGFIRSSFEANNLRLRCLEDRPRRAQGLRSSMENYSVPRIVNVDRMEGGILITFEDGTTAIYPTALLYANLPNAQQLIPEDECE